MCFISEAPCSRRSALCLSTSFVFSDSLNVTDLRLLCLGSISTMSASIVTLFDLRKFVPSSCCSPVSSFTWTATTMATAKAQHQPIICEPGSSKVSRWSNTYLVSMSLYRSCFRVFESSEQLEVPGDLNKGVMLGHTKYAKGGRYACLAAVVGNTN